MDGNADARGLLEAETLVAIAGGAVTGAIADVDEGCRNGGNRGQECSTDSDEQAMTVHGGISSVALGTFQKNFITYKKYFKRFL